MSKDSGRMFRWLKGCGCGCLALVILVVLLTVWGGTKMSGPFNDAVDARESLVEQFGAQEDFTPLADGTIPQERMETFLQIRQSMMEVCGSITDTFGAIQSMEELDGEEDPAAGEVMSKFFQMSKAVFSLGPEIGRFFQARNESLLREEMGLGEYTYIYAMVYGDRLIEQHMDGEITRIEIHVSSRVQAVLADMLRRQLDLAKAGSDEPWLAALEAETARLDNPAARVPWTGRLPAALESSIGPYRDQLDDLFCAQSIGMEMTRNRKLTRGFGFVAE
jgi:hypothetical protein